MDQALTLIKYQITFRDKTSIITTKERKEALEKLFDKYMDSGRDASIKSRDGSVKRVSQIVSIKRYYDDQSEGRKNMEKIEVELMSYKGKNPKIDAWLEKIKKNAERVGNWVYYDRAGRECSKEESRISVFS